MHKNTEQGAPSAPWRAVRDKIEDDEIIVETAYQPDPALWEPDFKTRRKSR